MPKGYNADGTKKVRPANSGRKSKLSKQIAPQISLEAATILESLKKHRISLNKFISEAILEKAANDANKKAAKSLAGQPTPGQVDLVEMIQEIKTERIVKSTQATPDSRFFGMTG